MTMVSASIKGSGIQTPCWDSREREYLGACSPFCALHEVCDLSQKDPAGPPKKVLVVTLPHIGGKVQYQIRVREEDLPKRSRR